MDAFELEKITTRAGKLFLQIQSKKIGRLGKVKIKIIHPIGDDIGGDFITSYVQAAMFLRGYHFGLQATKKQ